MSDEKKDVGFVEIKWVEGAGVYKRVPVADMEGWMKTGWRPLGMFRDLVTQERDAYVETKDHQGRYAGGHYERQYTDRECMCVLMVQDSTLMVAQYEKEKNAAQARAWEAEQKARDAEQAAEKAEKAKAEALATAEKAANANVENIERLTKVNATMQRLERDLGKVREAVGNDRMREILGR